MTDSGLLYGIALWSQTTTWDDQLVAARRVDALGYDTLFTDDHLYADSGDPDQPKLEAWTTLAAWGQATEHVRIAVGRDYRDVPPTRGVFRGAAQETLSVKVRVTQLAADELAPALRA